MIMPTTELVLPISKWTVTLATRITYGEDIRINQALMSGVKTNFEGKAPQFSGDAIAKWEREKILVVVKKINDGKTDIPVTNEVIDSLDRIDGQFLASEVNKILTAEKKS